MMKKYDPPTPTATAKKKHNDMFQTKQMKSRIFLKYSILVDLMHIVKKYSRNCEYNFNSHPKLATGPSSDQSKTDRNKIILCIDGFLSIWLLTLPEKFKEWYNQFDQMKIPQVK